LPSNTAAHRLLACDTSRFLCPFSPPLFTELHRSGPCGQQHALRVAPSGCKPAGSARNRTIEAFYKPPAAQSYQAAFHRAGSSGKASAVPPAGLHSGRAAAAALASPPIACRQKLLPGCEPGLLCCCRTSMSWRSWRRQSGCSGNCRCAAGAGRRRDGCWLVQTTALYAWIGCQHTRVSRTGRQHSYCSRLAASFCTLLCIMTSVLSHLAIGCPSPLQTIKPSPVSSCHGHAGAHG